MRLNATRYVILGLLSEGPLSGYDIKKLVDLRFRYFWNESYGQIYPELKKLTAEGLVEPAEGDSVPGGAGGTGNRPKKIYRITEDGRQAFVQWMNIAPESEKQRFEFLLKVYWAPWLPTERVGEYIRDFMTRHKGDLDMLRRMENEMIPILDEHPNHWWVLQTIRLGRRMNEAYLAWASELKTELEGMGDRDR